MKKKTLIWFVVALLVGFAAPVLADFDLSPEFQPNYESPRKYSRAEMDSLAKEVLPKIEKSLGTSFDRENPQHVLVLAEFFKLTSEEDLDVYSTPMEEGDVRYFADVEQFSDKELYPLSTNDLVIRFYWEGLARVAAAHYQLEVVNERRDPNPQKSRGKVSDMATTAMFEKRLGITLAQVVAEGKERYDFRRLIQHLKVKGLSRQK